MFHRITPLVIAVLPLLAFALGCSSDDSGTSTPAQKKCVAPAPPPEALRKMGDGSFLLPDGRALSPAGTNATLGGFPVDLRMHPSLPLVYVSNTGYASRSLQVVDATSGKVVDRKSTRLNSSH